VAMKPKIEQVAPGAGSELFTFSVDVTVIPTRWLGSFGNLWDSAFKAIQADSREYYRRSRVSTELGRAL